MPEREETSGERPNSKRFKASDTKELSYYNLNTHNQEEIQKKFTELEGFVSTERDFEGGNMVISIDSQTQEQNLQQYQE
jgi:hypothetical protein